MTYKLTYFNSKGRAETTRMMFALAGQKFEDVRMEGHGEQWQAMKPSTPFGVLPVIEVDGVMISQSKAIERLVAKRLGLYGDTDIEQAKTDMVIECIHDMSKPLEQYFSSSLTEEEKIAIKKKYEGEQLPKFLQDLDKMVDASGYTLGSKITWADVKLFNALSWPALVGLDIDTIIPSNLKQLCENVKNNKNISDWISKRPQTKF